MNIVHHHLGVLAHLERMLVLIRARHVAVCNGFLRPVQRRKSFVAVLGWLARHCMVNEPHLGHRAHDPLDAVPIGLYDLCAVLDVVEGWNVLVFAGELH